MSLNPWTQLICPPNRDKVGLPIPSRSGFFVLQLTVAGSLHMPCCTCRQVLCAFSAALHQAGITFLFCKGTTGQRRNLGCPHQPSPVRVHSFCVVLLFNVCRICLYVFNFLFVVTVGLNHSAICCHFYKKWLCFFSVRQNWELCRCHVSGKFICLSFILPWFTTFTTAGNSAKA